MMSPQVWKTNVMSAVKAIADEQFQRAAWFGLLPNVVSSPEEMICTLFDDFVFGDFLNASEIGLSQGSGRLACCSVKK